MQSESTKWSPTIYSTATQWWPKAMRRAPMLATSTSLQSRVWSSIDLILLIVVPWCSDFKESPNQMQTTRLCAAGLHPHDFKESPTQMQTSCLCAAGLHPQILILKDIISLNRKSQSKPTKDWKNISTYLKFVRSAEMNSLIQPIWSGISDKPATRKDVNARIAGNSLKKTSLWSATVKALATCPFINSWTKTRRNGLVLNRKKNLNKRRTARRKSSQSLGASETRTSKQGPSRRSKKRILKFLKNQLPISKLSPCWRKTFKWSESWITQMMKWWDLVRSKKFCGYLEIRPRLSSPATKIKWWASWSRFLKRASTIASISCTLRI